MEAIKAWTTVKNRQIVIDVSADLEECDVEVIILTSAAKKAAAAIGKEEFLTFLRDGPSLSDEEIKRIDEVKKEFRNWT